MSKAGRLRQMAMIGAGAAAILTACVVDTPGIDSTQPAPDPTAVVAPTEAPQFEPTAPPAPPTAVPTSTPVPEPTATPTPTGPPPLPTSAPEEEFAPVTVEPGLVVVPVRNARFMLAQARPVLQLGGHTLIYVDDARDAEVDIFTPAASRDGNTIDTYDALITYMSTDAALANLGELNPVSIAGFPTRVFEGTASATERAFITELAAADNDQLGWFPPGRMRLWVIDHPSGPVIVSAESLENPGRYSEAVRLATEILSTIDFG